MRGVASVTWIGRVVVVVLLYMWRVLGSDAKKVVVFLYIIFGYDYKKVIYLSYPAEK